MSFGIIRMLTVRRLQGTYLDLEKVKKGLSTSSIASDMIGAAVDEMNSVIYISMSQPKSLNVFNRLKCFEKVETWNCRDHIKAFAEKHQYLFLSGETGSHKTESSDQENPPNNLLSIKERIAFGSTVDDLEMEYLSNKDIKTLDLIFQNREELSTFEKALENVKLRIHENDSGKNFINSFVLATFV